MKGNNLETWGWGKDNGGKITNVLKLLGLCGMEEVKVTVKEVVGIYFDKVLL